MSFVYAKLLVVICVAYVLSDVVTHNIPLYYYEGFFTYLYGASILFLLYVFCFLLQESTCCSGGSEPSTTTTNNKESSKKNTKEKAKEAEKERKKEEDKKKKDEKDRLKKEKKDKEQKEKEQKEKDKADKDKDKKGKKQEKQEQQSGGGGQPPAPPPQPQFQSDAEAGGGGGTTSDIEAGAVQKTSGGKCKRKRKTTQNETRHGSFFLRIGAIAFGLGTMIYSGLEFGTFFEIPFTSKCHMILRGVNPLLQMIFTFMQMYFIFMNSRLNIHRFKVIARFGLMHVVATNICVWVRTFVIEYIKEITIYHRKFFNNTVIANNRTPFAESVRLHSLRNADTVLNLQSAKADLYVPTTAAAFSPTARSFLWNTARTAASTVRSFHFPTTTRRVFTTTKRAVPTVLYNFFQTNPATTTTTTSTTSTSPATTIFTTTTTSFPTTAETTSTSAIIQTSTTKAWNAFVSSSTPATTQYSNFLGLRDVNSLANVAEETDNSINGSESFDNLMPEALSFWKNVFNVSSGNSSNSSCGRVNIMGTIVQDSAPYLYPFIIEYSLIGAAVIYVMWKHIGRNPRYVTEEDLEHRLEVMLSRRAVARAHAQQAEKVDCVGASKGLFFGLLLLVASLICLILFFVLIHHPDFGLLAIYLADVSHCVLMALSIIAIIIGFIRMSLRKPKRNCRVQHLKFRTEDQSDLNDILLRVSAFGLFLYAVFSVIAGHLNAFTKEPNLLVMITGALSIVQVILQLLFIADVSRRRVHLPEHDRTKPGRQVVTFLLICNVTMWIIYTFEIQKVKDNPVQLDFYGFLAWAFVQRITLPLCIFHRFHSAVTFAEIWKTSYKARLD